MPLVNRWSTNTYSCSIPKRFTGIKDCIMLNLNKKELYNEDASYLHKFDDAHGHDIVHELYYDLFLEVIQQANEKTAFLIEGKGKKEPKKATKKKTRKRAKRTGSRRAPRGVNFVGSDDEDENIAIDEGNNSDAGSDKEDDENDEANDEADQLNSMTTSIRYVDVFFEAVIKKGHKEYIGRPGKKIEVTDYRYFLVSYTDKVNLDVIGDEIYSKSRKLNAELFRKRARTGTAGLDVDMKAHEKWKAITSKGQWAYVMDSYIGHKRASNNLEEVEGLKLSNPRNPACITKFFNPTWAFRNTSKDAESLQSEWNAQSYFKRNTDDQTWTLKFPMPKFVYRLSLSDMQSHVLHSKIMPDQQQRTINQFIKMMPLLLKDPQLHEPDLNAKKIQEDADDINPLANGKRDKLSRSTSDINDSGAEDDFDREFNIASRGTNRLSSSTNSITGNHGSQKKTVKEDTRNGKTRSRQRESIAKLFGIDDHIEKSVMPVDKNDILLSGQSKLLDTLMTIPGALMLYASCYTHIALAAKRNLDKIRADMSSANRGVGFWAELKNPCLVARKLYLYNQDMVFREYNETCRNPEAGLSPAGKKIMREMKRESLYSDHGVEHYKFDKRFTTFVNQELRLYDQWDQVYLINHAHKFMNLAHKNSFDAYCMNFNRVHQNMITQGLKGGESKSYIWTVLADHLRIKETVEILTYETLKSRATDEPNMNDNIVIFDEIEKAIFDQHLQGNDKERAFKLLLATNKVCAKLLQIDEDGRRTTKVTYSECITVFFGSTNSDLSCMSTAMKRRWHVGHFDERFGINRAIIELELAGMILSDIEKSYRSKLDKEHHLLQTMVFEIEKLIHCKGLSDISMHVPMIIMLYIANELHATEKPEPNPSMFQRILILARINCILDAIDKTFFIKGAKHFGKSIHVNDFKDLDRKLFCSSQHVVSALGETIELLIDPAEPIIKRAIRHMVFNDNTVQNHRKRRPPVTNTPKVQQTNNNNDGDEQFESLVSDPDPHATSVRKNLITHAQREILANGIAKPKSSPLNDLYMRESITSPFNHHRMPFAGRGRGKGSYAPKYDWFVDSIPDYTYCRFNYRTTLENLVTRISNHVGFLTNPRPAFRPSNDVIKSLLKTLCGRSFMSRSYILIGDDKKGNVIESTTGPEEPSDVAYLAEGCIYIHRKYINQVDTDVSPEDYIANIIKKVFVFKHQLPQNFCFTPSETEPHIRNILAVSGGLSTSNVLMIPSVVQVSAAEQSILSGVGQYTDAYRTHRYIGIDTDIDSWGMMERNKLLYLVDKQKDGVVKTYKVDPECMTSNPLDFIGKKIINNPYDEKSVLEEASDKEDQEDQNEEEENENDDDEEEGQLVRKSRTANAQDNDNANIDDPMMDIDFDIIKNSTRTIGIQKQTSDDIEKSLFTDDEDDDNNMESKKKSKKTGKSFKRIKPKANVRESESDDDTISGNNIGEEEEQRDVNEDEDEEEESNDSDIDEEPLDDDYDEKIGYFMGERLDCMFVDDIQSMETLSNEDIVKMYNHLDEYNPDTIIVDYDFDPEEFMISKDEATSEPIYHWDVLGKSELISKLKEQMKKNNHGKTYAYGSDDDDDEYFNQDPTDSQYEEEDDDGNDEEYDYSKLDTGKLRDLVEKYNVLREGCSFKWISDAEKKYMLDDEYASLKKTAYDANISKYKTICVHPLIMDNLENLKYYSDDNAVLPSGKKMLYKYPEDMVRHAKETRKGRWEKGLNKITNDESLKTELFLKIHKTPDAETDCLFLTYELNAKNEITRDASNEYCLVQNSLQTMMKSSHCNSSQANPNKRRAEHQTHTTDLNSMEPRNIPISTKKLTKKNSSSNNGRTFDFVDDYDTYFPSGTNMGSSVKQNNKKGKQPKKASGKDEDYDYGFESPKKQKTLSKNNNSQSSRTYIPSHSKSHKSSRDDWIDDLKMPRK